MTVVKVQPELPDWPGDHMRRYLASDGAEGYYVDFRSIGRYELTPSLILTTTGRRTGEQRMLPLIYGEIDGNCVIVASKAGASNHPAWYLNLETKPEVGVQIKGRRFSAQGRTAVGAERASLWQEMAKIYPPYDQYQDMTTREIPVIVLEPIA